MHTEVSFILILLAIMLQNIDNVQHLAEKMHFLQKASNF